MEETTHETWHRYKDKIKVDLKGIGCEDVDWIQLLSMESNHSLM
jgi:hypothetical protein